VDQKVDERIETDGGTETDGDGEVETSTWAECVGPLTIPPALRNALRRLAEAAAVDDLAPLSVCATELVRRLSRPGAPTRAWVIRGRLEAVTPLSTQRWDPTISFRDALRRSVDRRVSTVPVVARGMSTVPVDVAILVSQDGDRLYVESMTTSADAPTAQQWARSFLRLLSCTGNQPDVPLAAHALTVG
jgi:hypothetical protein